MEKENLTNEDRLDKILFHLNRLDRRDRLRTWGGFFRSILSLIPTVILLIGLWYFYENQAAILQAITQEATKQAAAIASGVGQKAVALPPPPDLIKELKNLLHLQ